MFWLPENYNGESVDYIYDTCYFGWHSYAYIDDAYKQYTKTFFDSLYAGSTALEARVAAEHATNDTVTNGELFRDYGNFRLHWPNGYPGPGQ